MKILFNHDISKFLVISPKGECLAAVTSEEVAVSAKKMYEELEDEFYNNADYAGEQESNSHFIKKYL